MSQSTRDVVLLTPIANVVDRVDLDELIKFMQTTARFAEASVEGREQSMQLSVALVPGGRPIFEVLASGQVNFEQTIRALLTRSLREVAAPSVNDVVMFAHRIAAKDDPGELPFRNPFTGFLTNRSQRTLDATLLEASGSATSAPSKRWWKTILSKQRARSAVDELSHSLGCVVRHVLEPIHVAYNPPIRLERSTDSPLIVMQTPNGSTQVIDQMMAEYYESELPQPTQTSLDRLFDRAELVRLYDRPLSMDRVCIARLESRAEIDLLRRAMSICDGPGGHCMCIGDATIELSRGNGEMIAEFSSHHGQAIRCSRWKDDALLIDGIALLRWLDGRGVSEPLVAYVRAMEEERNAAETWRLWFERMPRCLSGLSIGEWREGAESIRRRLDGAYADASAAILDLLEWNGSGSSAWTAYPLHESTPRALLETYSRESILAAVQNADLTDRQLGGCARLFFPAMAAPELPLNPWRQEYSVAMPPPSARSDLPAELARRLLKHCRESGNEGVREHAEILFGGEGSSQQ